MRTGAERELNCRGSFLSLSFQSSAKPGFARLAGDILGSVRTHEERCASPPPVDQSAPPRPCANREEPGADSIRNAATKKHWRGMTPCTHFIANLLLTRPSFEGCPEVAFSNSWVYIIKRPESFQVESLSGNQNQSVLRPDRWLSPRARLGLAYRWRESPANQLAKRRASVLDGDG